MSLLRCTFIFSWVSREDQDVMEKKTRENQDLEGIRHEIRREDQDE
jgi:hypothetical protein